MATIVIDLDGTLTIEDSAVSYQDARPNIEVVERLRQYKEQGFTIAIFTARNMRTYEKSVGKINANTIPIIIEWLNQHDVPFDELHVGKPWPDTGGFYVDDRAIRPKEFVTLSYDQIMELTRGRHDDAN